MAAVMIGAGPHEASHTAVAISAAEQVPGELRVPASPGRAERLLAWAAAWPRRAWAIGGAGGLGRLLARLLVAAGERVPGRAPQARRPGAAAGHRGHQQERPRRRPLCGDRGAALALMPGSDRR